jgi:hypothetical protein
MFSVRRGQEFSIVYPVLTGSVTGLETVRSVLKLALKSKFPPGDSAAEALVFSMSFEAGYALPEGMIEGLASADVFIASASAAQSAGLAAGIYITDLRFDDGVAVTRPQLIEIFERVSEPV